MGQQELLGHLVQRNASGEEGVLLDAGEEGGLLYVKLFFYSWATVKPIACYRCVILYPIYMLADVFSLRLGPFWT